MAFTDRLHNRGSISTGYDIDNSLKFESNNSEHLHRTPSSAGNTKTWTYSVWVKRTELGVSAQLISALDTYMYFETNDQAWLNFRSGGENFFLATNRVFRDTSAWYHVVIVCDVTDSTAADRAKLYINGVRETSYANTTYQNLDSNDTTGINAATVHRVGSYSNYGSYFNGYMAEAHLIDGQALDPTYFGEFDQVTGIWKPKAYTGSYGTNGFYLDFSDGANLGDDTSGNGNNFTEASITAADQSTDTPTNNFCTFNPLMYQNNKPTITEGAMKSTGGGGTWNQTWGTIGIKNGKWYYEMKVTNTSSTGYIGASTTPAEGSSTSGSSLMYDTSFMMGTASGIDYYYWQNGSQTSNEATGWGNLVNNDVLGLALDLDASTKKFYLYKNGSLLNSGGTNLPTNMQDEFIFPLYVQYENRQDEINFGGYTTSTISSAETDENGYGTFEYAPPSGYYALCTKNLAEYG